MRGSFSIGGVVGSIVLITVGTYVVYQVISSLETEMGSNLTGLWALAYTLLKILAPVFFILLAVKVFNIA